LIELDWINTNAQSGENAFCLAKGFNGISLPAFLFTNDNKKVSLASVNC